MMTYLDTEDNIVALSTALGVGSVDIIKIGGPDLAGLYKSITKTSPKQNTIKKEYIYSLLDGEIVDICMVSFFKGPRSFTGQDIVEINCHGGGYISSNIIRFICESGAARMALPGEFLFRAYVNNKVDLVQAEAINDIILSESLVQKNKSLENVDGKLSGQIKLIKNKIVNLLMVLEHELDFDESEILHFNESEIIKIIKDIRKEIERVVGCFFFSKTVRSGIRVLLLGKPNVGKSSIYNELLGVNRSIVSSAPGTTRDTIESVLEIGGHRVVLIDSAGSWESVNKIEKMGIERTKKEIKKSHIILLVGEHIKDIKPFYPAVKGKDFIEIYSKSDIHNIKGKGLRVSTVTSSGFRELSTRILTIINDYNNNNKANNLFLINDRQRNVLDDCLKQIYNIEKGLAQNIGRDILADLIRLLLDEFNNIINPVDRDDILNTIFSGFCVGK